MLPDSCYNVFMKISAQVISIGNELMLEVIVFVIVLLFPTLFVSILSITIISLELNILDSSPIDLTLHINGSWELSINKSPTPTTFLTLLISTVAFGSKLFCIVGMSINFIW